LTISPLQKFFYSLALIFRKVPKSAFSRRDVLSGVILTAPLLFCER